ncbi:MAG: phosphoribosylformylglycinamidine cyclo-ligase [Thermoplasmata archaeon]
MKPRTYKESGVDIEREDRSIAALASQLAYTRQGLGAPFGPAGFFTSLIDFGEWALTLNTDGVGTKLLVARDLGRWDTVGIDCVAMSVNDCLCVGAEPLAFVDYFAVGKYDESVAREVGRGLNRGAELADVTVVGGEFSTVPEIVQDYDLVGACVGSVRKDAIIDGTGVQPGQVIVGLRSSGLHSSGFTLVRKLLQAEGIALQDPVPGAAETFGEALLRPTEIYVRDVRRVLQAVDVTGMAHVTGGGLLNLGRIRSDVAYQVDDPFPPQPIFVALQALGHLDPQEMYRTFNMGQGFALIMGEEEADAALELLRDGGEAQVIGTVTEGQGVHLPGEEAAL